LTENQTEIEFFYSPDIESSVVELVIEADKFFRIPTGDKSAPSPAETTSKAHQVLRRLGQTNGAVSESSWKLLQQFEFDASAEEVCKYILGHPDYRTSRTIRMTDELWACEAVLSGCIPPGALYSIIISMNISDGKELGWLRDNAVWLVNNKEVGEIVLKQVRTNICIGTLYVETNPQRWAFDGNGMSMDVGTRFAGQLWHDLVTGWSRTKKATLVEQNESNLIGYTPDQRRLIDQACIGWAGRGYSPFSNMSEFLNNFFRDKEIFLSVDQFKDALRDAGKRGLIVKVGRRWRLPETHS
jgi:hypothetical protein